MNKIDIMDKQAMMSAINEAAEFIESKIKGQPDVALVLGSGLGNFANQISNPVIIPFESIPHFPKPTVEGHGGKLFYGQHNGKNVLILQGRFHYYEGYGTQTTTFPIRVFAKLKIKDLILTNACGGVNKHFNPGDLMVIEDHLSLFCPNPLRGAHLDEFGERFVDMSQPYDRQYISLAQACAKELKIKLQKGVYAFWQGPTYESAAEVRAFMTLGADVVGMSTVPEDIVAVSAKMRVLGISCITNMTCIYSKGITSHEEVMDMGKAVEKDFTNLLNSILTKM